MKNKLWLLIVIGIGAAIALGTGHAGLASMLGMGLCFGTVLNYDAALKAAETNFRAIWAEADGQSYPVNYPQLAGSMGSTGRANDYSWVGDIPHVKEWLTEREIEQLTAHHFEIYNKLWEDTFGLRRTDIEDDQLGHYPAIIRQMVLDTKFHPELLTFAILDALDSTLCFDGGYMAADAHVGFDKNGAATTWDNLDTHALTTTYYDAARKFLNKVCKKNGTPWNMGGQLYLIVAEEERATAEAIVLANVVSGTTNTRQGTSKLIVSPLMTSPHWAMVYGNVPIGGLVYQERVPTTLEMLGAPNAQQISERTFMKDDVIFGTRARYNVGALLWQRVFYSTGAS